MQPSAQTERDIARDTAPAGETPNPGANTVNAGTTGAKTECDAQTRPDFTRALGLSPAVEKQIDDAFEYHAWDEVQTLHGNTIRQALASAVKTIVAIVPPCPDRTAAIRKLREARMDCNSAITHNGRY